MPWYRIVVWISEKANVRVLRGFRFFDMDIEEARIEVWQKTDEAFPTAAIQRVDLEQLPNDSRSLKRYLIEAERQRMEAKIKKRGR